MGGKLLLSGGSFDIQSDLPYHANMELAGEGKATILALGYAGSILNWTATGAIPLVGFTLRDMLINFGAHISVTTYGLMISGGANFTVRDILIDNVEFVDGDHVHVMVGGNVDACRNITVKNCQFKRISTASIYDMIDPLGVDVHIINNQFVNRTARACAAIAPPKGINMDIKGNIIDYATTCPTDYAIELVPYQTIAGYTYAFENVAIERNILRNAGICGCVGGNNPVYGGFNVRIANNLINNESAVVMYVAKFRDLGGAQTKKCKGYHITDNVIYGGKIFSFDGGSVDGGLIDFEIKRNYGYGKAWGGVIEFYSIVNGQNLSIQDNEIVENLVNVQQWFYSSGVTVDGLIIRNNKRRDMGLKSTLSWGIVATNVILENNTSYLATGESREYTGALVQVAQNGAVIARQNPEAQAALATAVVRITTGGGAVATGPMGLTTSVVVEDCEDAWNESVLAEVTSTLNTTDFERGAGSAQLAVAAGVVDDEILATEARAAQDLSAYTHLLFKIKSSVATAAADLRMLISENINCGAPAETLDVPALVANQWTLVVVPFVNAGATRDAIISIGLQYHDNPAVCTILIDDVRAITVGTTVFAGAAVDLNAAAIYDSMNVADAGAGQGKPIAIDAKNGTNDVLVMVATGGAAGAIVGSYYMKLVGQ